MQQTKGINGLRHRKENRYCWESFASLEGNPYKSKVDLTSLRCLLLHLTKSSDYSKNDYPIALGYMASLLRMNGGTAKILKFDTCSEFKIEELNSYDLICFFPMSFFFKEVFKIAAQIKQKTDRAKICLLNSDQHQHEMILCSPDALKFGCSIMQNYTMVDFVLIGEAEKSFLMLCENIALKTNNFKTIPSCIYRENNEVKISEAGIRPIDFKFMPFPSRDFLEDSISPKGINHHSPRIQSSRGCISSCLYCAESAANRTAGGRSKPWLGRRMDQFIDEIEFLQKKYGVVFFNIIDSSFEDPGRKGLERLNDFCGEIISRGIKASFKAHFRMETFNKFGDDMLERLKNAGIDILVIGAESGLEKELRSYKKITSVEQNCSTVKRLNMYDKFFVLLGHLAFSPLLKLSDLPKKIDFLMDIQNGWDYLNMSNNLIVYRGTAYHRLIEKKGLTGYSTTLSPVISYNYVDERVKIVAREMGNLRIKCDAVITLHNLLYDCQNIKARFSNKMNQHLWRKKRIYERFVKELKNILKEVETIYCEYFLSLVSLVRENSPIKLFDQLYEDNIPKKIPIIAEETQSLRDNFINDLKARDGSGVEKLYLKTWMSLINTETNTSKGRVS